MRGVFEADDLRHLQLDVAVDEVVIEHAAGLEELDKDRAFLKAGGVFDDDFIDSYIELKMTEVIRFEHTPHPVEYDMYYSA